VDDELHGVMAEFLEAKDVVAAAGRARAAGWREMDAYSPFPVEGLADALGLPPTRMPAAVLAAGAAGATGGYLLQYWAMAVSSPLNAGGRPLNGWPSYVPVTFELTILCAALAAAFGMLAANGLPRPHHPVFNEPAFARASRSRFFLCLEARDPLFEKASARRFLESLSPAGVYDVPR
jgi:hypothetical protein